MTTRKEQLLALAERCGAGDKSAHNLIREALKYGSLPHVPEAWAYNETNAELDAVAALERELLPKGWRKELIDNGVFMQCSYWEPMRSMNLPATVSAINDDDLCLAWLAALLKCLAERETE